MRTVPGDRKLLSTDSAPATVVGALPGLAPQGSQLCCQERPVQPGSAPTGALGATLGQLITLLECGGDNRTFLLGPFL